MKRITFSQHALRRLGDRGTDEQEVRQAIQDGRREPVHSGRFLCRLNVQFNAQWQGTFYAVKQVAPVVVETSEEIIVVTVYTFFF